MNLRVEVDRTKPMLAMRAGCSVVTCWDNHGYQQGQREVARGVPDCRPLGGVYICTSDTSGH